MKKNIGVIHIILFNEQKIELEANEFPGEIENEEVYLMVIELFKQKNSEHEIKYKRTTVLKFRKNLALAI